jgi:hypothetical protein
MDDYFATLGFNDLIILKYRWKYNGKKKREYKKIAGRISIS